MSTVGINVEEINILHDKAMEYIAKANEAEKKGDIIIGYRENQVLAYQLEKEAADKCPNSIEPSHSNLCHSAATMAKDMNLYGDAERLALKGFTGNPSPEVQHALFGILNEVSPALLQQNLDSMFKETPKEQISRLHWDCITIIGTAVNCNIKHTTTEAFIHEQDFAVHRLEIPVKEIRLETVGIIDERDQKYLDLWMHTCSKENGFVLEPNALILYKGCWLISMEKVSNKFKLKYGTVHRLIWNCDTFTILYYIQ